jgi:hypothetical protein
MGKLGFIKGLAAGAVLGAAASYLSHLAGDEKSVKALKKVADDVRERIVKHAKELGKLTKAAYNQIVETTVAEYTGAKALSETELAQLKKDLKAGWKELEREMKKRKA